MSTGRNAQCADNSRGSSVQGKVRHLHAAASGRSGRSDLSELIGALDALMVTRREAARLLSLSTTEIDYARRRGDLAAVRYGSKVLISVDELRRFAKSLPADELS
jgi:hypothetical protein